MTNESLGFSLDAFLAYSDALRERLDAREEVVGLVFLGSAAETARADEWSDHDFFVIGVDDQAEALRQNVDWLPNFDQISIAVRETDHGLKVVYKNGQVLEFAVFKVAELEMASASAFAVAIDKCNLQQRMQALADKSVARPADRKREFELILCQLLIGVGRARRGEQLIAGQHIRSWAINNLLGLVQLSVEPVAGTEDQADIFSRYRRFEKQFPAIGQRIELAQQLPLESCAKALLELAVEVSANSIGQSELDQIGVIRQRLGWF